VGCTKRESKQKAKAGPKSRMEFQLPKASCHTFMQLNCKAPLKLERDRQEGPKRDGEMGGRGRVTVR